MPLDSFYRLPTVKRFVEKSGAKNIEAIVDIGVNVGDTLLLLHRYFPAARIIGFEPLAEYFDIALRRTEGTGRIELHNKAVTSDHLFFDDFGERPRPCRMALTIAKATPESGVGWRGGSLIGPTDHELLAAAVAVPGYQRLAQPVSPITLAEILAENAIDEIDLLKLDCEGCESSVLGSATLETLRRVRFITGEYHGLARFYPAMRKTLFHTHKVCLTGDTKLGSFFAERRRGERDGILSHRTTRAPVADSDEPIEWNPLRERWPRLGRWRAARSGIR
jgi:FkbM family methyltransferase